MFLYIHRLEIDMISMRSSDARTQLCYFKTTTNIFEYSFFQHIPNNNNRVFKHSWYVLESPHLPQRFRTLLCLCLKLKRYSLVRHLRKLKVTLSFSLVSTVSQASEFLCHLPCITACPLWRHVKHFLTKKQNKPLTKAFG